MNFKTSYSVNMKALSRRVILCMLIYSFIDSNLCQVDNQNAQDVQVQKDFQPNPRFPKKSVGDAQHQEGQDTHVKQKKLAQFKLSEVPACSQDIRKYCNPKIIDNNFEVIDCLQSDDKASIDYRLRHK